MHTNSSSSSTYQNQNQNVHIEPEERRSFQSIKYQFTPSFSFHHLLAEKKKIHIALFFFSFFLLYQRTKTQLSEVPIQKEATPPTVITVYIYVFVVNTYTVMQKRAVERRASRCWCSMGKPLQRQGSPVSPGCWEVLGYWV